ncbi:MAG: hypothetical protein ACPG6L_11525 [Nereida ignava]
MQDKTDDELAALGWSYVARDHMGKVAAVNGDDSSDLREQIMEWLGEGWTVSKLFE